MKNDFEPCLGPGRHLFTLSELRCRFVDDFNTTDRFDLFLALNAMLQRLSKERVVCEVWINGSFVTTKDDPDDIDLAIVIHFEQFEELSGQTKLLLEEIAEYDQKYEGVLDTYVCVEYPIGDPRRDLDDPDEYAELWAVGHDEMHLKGFAVIKVPL